MPLRHEFPPPGDPSYLGGSCDGDVYSIAFRSSTLQKAYDMVLAFLKEEGYADLPYPKDAEELKKFKRKAGQMQMFDENGYIHNPVKILFHQHSTQRNTLIVKLYNEQSEGHLLRFHGRI
jgi:hypothetical protein